jgi:hypothetical protein
MEEADGGTDAVMAWAEGGVVLHPDFRSFLADANGMRCSEPEINQFFQGFGIISVQDIVYYGLQPMGTFMSAFPNNWWNTPSRISAAIKLRILACHIKHTETTAFEGTTFRIEQTTDDPAESGVYLHALDRLKMDRTTRRNRVPFGYEMQTGITTHTLSLQHAAAAALAHQADITQALLQAQKRSDTELGE